MYFSGIKEKLRFSNYKYNIVTEIEKGFIDRGYLYLEANPFEEYEQIVIEQRVNPEKLVKLVDPQGKIKVLSSDITSGLIEDIKRQWSEGLEIKVFYRDRVYKIKDDNIKIFEKLGVECFGNFSYDVDLEILSMAHEVLNKFSDNFLIEVGMSSIVYYMLDSLELKKNEREVLINSISNKDSYEIRKILKQMEDNEGVEFFYNIFNYRGNIIEVKKELEKFNLPKYLIKSLCSLEKNFIELEKKGIVDNFYFDLSFIPEFNYYSAFSFRGYFEDYNGEIIKGGRYILNSTEEDLVVPGVGFSIEVADLIKHLGGKLI